VITLERDYEQALGIRPSVSAVIFDRRGRLPLQQRSVAEETGLRVATRTATCGTT